MLLLSAAGNYVEMMLICKLFFFFVFFSVKCCFLFLFLLYIFIMELLFCCLGQDSLEKEILNLNGTISW